MRIISRNVTSYEQFMTEGGGRICFAFMSVYIYSATGVYTYLLSGSNPQTTVAAFIIQL